MRTLIFLLLSCSVSFGQFTLRNPAFVASIKAPAAEAGGAFAPSDISGLLRWYKADAITGKSENDTLDSWIDSSGTFNATDRGGYFTGMRYKTGVFGSLPAVLFTNGAAAFDIGEPQVTATKPMTVFFVYKKHDDGAARTMLDLQNNDSGQTYRHYFDAEDDANNRLIVWVNYDDYMALGSPAGTHVVTATFVQGGISHASYDGGTAVDSNGGGNYLNDYNNVSVIGATSEGGNNFTGYFAELIIYNTVLSEENQQAVEAYLKTKWGTP